MPRFTLLLASLLALAAQSALATRSAQAADMYECRLRVQHNVVPELLLVEIGPEGSAVKVNDPVIRHFVGRPLEARVMVDNPRRTTFGWEMTITNSANQHARVVYRLTVLKPALTADIHADALGYAGDLTGRGRCVRLTARPKR